MKIPPLILFFLLLFAFASTVYGQSEVAKTYPEITNRLKPVDIGVPSPFDPVSRSAQRMTSHWFRSL